MVFIFFSCYREKYLYTHQLFKIFSQTNIKIQHFYITMHKPKSLNTLYTVKNKYFPFILNIAILYYCNARLATRDPSNKSRTMRSFQATVTESLVPNNTLQGMQEPAGQEKPACSKRSLMHAPTRFMNHIDHREG